MRTRPALHDDEDEAEAEAGCYEAEVDAENFGLEAIEGPPWVKVKVTSRTQRQHVFLTCR